MTTNTIYYLIIGFISGEFILSLFLSYLNTKYWSEELPKEAVGIYDEEKYRKSQEYEKTKYKYSLFARTFSFFVLIVFFALGGFGYLDSLLRVYISNDLLLTLCFFGIISLVQIILDIPFSYRETFVIEEKFDFNKSTKKIFFLDILKSILVSFVIGFLLLSLIFFAYQKLENNFWLVAWAILSFFSIFMMMFASNIIVPLFNKQTPLEDGELRDEIENFSKKVGFKLNNIFTIDGSKRSSKANAYFTGFGPKKRIVLFDTLINDLTSEEIVAVLAHEIGHYKKKHSLQMLIFSILQIGFMIYLFSLALNIKEVSLALGGTIASFHLGLIAFSILFMPLSIILGVFGNIWSRKNEYEADNFAGLKYNSLHLQNALKKLTTNNLSNLRPHPWYEFFYYSHPTILKRLANLESLKKYE